MDVAAPIEPGTWSDNQIMAYVPDASGVQAFNGQMYVKTTGGQSTVTPFNFIPTMDVQSLKITDANVQMPADGCGSGEEKSGWLDAPWMEEYVTHVADCFEGYSRDDSFLSSTTLKNGWVL